MRFPPLRPMARSALVLGALALCPTLASRSGAAPSPSADPPTASSTRASPPAPTGREHSSVAIAVDQLVRTVEGWGGTAGVRVLEVETGRVLAAHNDDKALNPASNMKLLTAAAALWRLSGDYRFRTALYGNRRGERVGSLVLRGYGDPTLETADVWDLARRVRRSGVKRVEGSIFVDQSYFDASYVPPGFDQQPDEWAYFRAPISAIALNRNSIAATVYPTAADQRAIVAFDPPGFVTAQRGVQTKSAGSAQDVLLKLTQGPVRLRAKLGGSIPEDSRPITITKRVEDPTLVAGFALKALLEREGVTVDGDVRLGGKGGGLLAMQRSRPLAELLSELGKNSDNFYAEMIFKSLAGKKKRKGLRSADGAKVVRAYLDEVGISSARDVIKNGSGLFDTNRLTAATITSVLQNTWRDPNFRPEYVSHLAIAGVDGTLRSRFRGTQARRVVRAKTGTLSSVAALSGYVLAPDGRSPVAFSIMLNGIRGRIPGARVAIDKCVQRLSAHVWESKRQRP